MIIKDKTVYGYIKGSTGVALIDDFVIFKREEVGAVRVVKDVCVEEHIGSA